MTNATYCAMQRRADDRKHLLYKLERLGYIPDSDIADAIEDIVETINARMKKDNVAMTQAETVGLEDDD